MTLRSRAVAIGLGGLLLAGVAAGCSSDPIASYLADARDTLSDADNASAADNQLIYAGKILCSMEPEARANPANFGQVEFVEVALDHCEALAAANPDGFPMGGEEGLAGEAEANAGEAAGLSDRGAIPAKVGERIESWGPPMAAGVGQYFTITAIRPVTSCAGQGIDDQGGSEAVSPTNGRFLAVDVKLENTTDFDAAQAGYYPGGAQQYDFVAEDGTAFDQVDTLDAFYCTGEESPFSQLQPGRNYTGTKYIDVPRSGGWLIFGQSPNGGSGYEYQVPPA